MTDTDAIAEARKGHIDAFNRADVDGMAAGVSDDVVAMPPNLPAVVGKEGSRAWWRAGFDAGKSRFEFTPTELVVTGDLAYDRFQWNIETAPAGGGQGTRDHGECVWLWKKDAAGEWLLWRAIWNSDNEAPGVWSGASRDSS